MIPSPLEMSLTGTPCKVAAASGPSRRPARAPFSVTGPDWIRPTIELLASDGPWPRLQLAGSGNAMVRVEAPDRPDAPPADLPDASYELTIDADRLTIRCSEPAGLVAALGTLGQLADQGLRTGRIVDRPAFRYRGMHLDVCRHFFDARFVRRLLVLEAALGFNVFHWHLTEDQGWRLPVDSRPELLRVGAWREAAAGAQPGGRYGGHYTKEEIRDVVATAGRLGILVIPEVESPGHAQAAVASYPELGCTGAALPVRTAWGISEEVFCAGREEPFAFLADVFGELVELFPSRLVHIGGDECPRARWMACPECSRRMAAEGLADYDALQSCFVRRVAAMLAEHGKTPIGWDEILDGGLADEAIVMSWRGTSGGVRAVGMGHPVIMTPTEHCYFDYAQTEAPEAPGMPAFGEGQARRVLALDKVYAFDPVADVADDVRSLVLGGQANVWTEHIADEPTAEEMIAPRILAMAEALWAAPADRDFASFVPKAREWLPRLRQMGWRAAQVPELG